MQGKYVILGVASEWTNRKGLKDFIKLEEMLDKTKYRIVLVGLTEKQIEELPDTIIGIKTDAKYTGIGWNIYKSKCLF